MGMDNLYQLYGYLDPVPSETGFVTPVFRNGNDLFVQLSFDKVTVSHFEALPKEYEIALKQDFIKLKNIKVAVGHPCFFGLKYNNEVWIDKKGEIKKLIENITSPEEQNDELYWILQRFIDEVGADTFKEEILKCKENLMAIFNDNLFEQIKRKINQDELRYVSIIIKEVDTLSFKAKYSVKIPTEILWNELAQNLGDVNNNDTRLILKNWSLLQRLSQDNQKVRNEIKSRNISFLINYFSRYVSLSYISIGGIIKSWSDENVSQIENASQLPPSDYRMLQIVLNRFKKLWEEIKALYDNPYSLRMQSTAAEISQPSTVTVLADSNNKNTNRQQQREEKYIDRGILDAKRGIYNPPWLDELDEDKLTDNENYEKGWDEGRSEMEL